MSILNPLRPAGGLVFGPNEYDGKYRDLQDVAGYISALFTSFANSRKAFEEVWQECWYNFLGQYQANTRWRETEGEGRGKSKVFIKLTGLKCHTAHAKIIDICGDSFAFDLEPLRFMTFSQEERNAIIEVAEKRVAILRDHFKSIRLSDSRDSAILEMAILGTAVLKGPVEVYVDMGGGQNRPIPVIDHVPLWEYYVDANAKSSKDSIGEIHYKRMLPAQFKREILSLSGVIQENVIEAARRATTTDEYDTKYIQLGDMYMGREGLKDKRVVCVEFWGLVPVSMLKPIFNDFPAGIDEGDSIEALVMLGADGLPLKVEVNTSNKRPFYVCPFKKKPHTIYGLGVAEAVRDSQKMINSAARMIIDNKKISGNQVIGLNINRIDTKRTKDLTVYAGKTFYVKGNYAPREAIDAINFPDITNGLRELMEMFERFADEETFPKYTQGEQDSFLNKTATGISMLMTQANMNFKAVIKNIDDYWAEPIVTDFDLWFEEKGLYPQQLTSFPLRVISKGTASLIAKEIRLEQIQKFLQATATNAQDQIFVNRLKVIQEISRLLECDDLMNDKETIGQLLQNFNKTMNMPKALREIVKVEALFPLLTPSEQTQVLAELGIQPDPQRMATVTDRTGLIGAGVPGQPSPDQTGSNMGGVQGGISGS
jgi:hypothetical protein